MNTTPTKRSAKAKKRWAYPYEDGDVVTDVPPSKHDVKRGFCRPVFLLPASHEDVERMRDQAHAAIAGDPDYASIAHHQYLDLVGTVFKAIGLTLAKKTKAL